MLGIDAATGALTVPIWAVGAASAVFVVAMLLAIGGAGAGNLISALFRVGIVALAVLAGWFYMQRVEQQEYAAERRLLDERSAALLGRAVAPGSALSCLDELASEAVEAACEKAVFASPEAVAAAVSYVTAKLALLVDGNDHARRADAAFVAELAPLRAALELDRFGIVAHVLTKRYGCTANKCDMLNWFSDQSRVLANLRDHIFDEQVQKFATIWNGPSRAALDATVAAAPTAATPAAATPQLPGPAPVMVSPRYDFPSSQSIPPVNIMVPESPSPSPAPRVGAVSNGQSVTGAGDGHSRGATTPPVPSRRPPPVRAPSAAAGVARPPNAQPAVPVAADDAPTDGAVSRQTGSIQPR